MRRTEIRKISIILDKVPVRRQDSTCYLQSLQKLLLHVRRQNPPVQSFITISTEDSEKIKR